MYKKFKNVNFKKYLHFSDIRIPNNIFNIIFVYESFANKDIFLHHLLLINFVIYYISLESRTFRCKHCQLEVKAPITSISIKRKRLELTIIFGQISQSNNKSHIMYKDRLIALITFLLRGQCFL